MRLNLGCGANLFEGWVNVDVDDVEESYIRHLRDAQHVDGWPEWQQRQWSFIQGGGRFDFEQCDFVKDQPLAAIRIGCHPSALSCRVFENDCEAIYLGQVVEHLNAVHELPQLLARCYGALKPGGVLRMTTPDLDVILDHYARGQMSRFAGEQPLFYRDAHPSDQLAYLLFGATGPNCTRKNYEGHFHAWVPETLTKLCLEAGFKFDNQDWPSKRLLDCRDFGQSHSFALEVVKP